MPITLAIIIIVVISFITINLVNLPIAELFINSNEIDALERGYELPDLIVTILYPILDKFNRSINNYFIKYL